MPDQWILSIGFACFLMASLVAVATPARNFPWTLRLFLFILGSAALQMSLVRFGLAERFAALTFLMDPLDIAFAPLAYLYLRNLNGKSIPVWRLCLHFVPSLVAILATIPFWSSHAENKINYYRASMDFSNWRWPSDEGTVWIILVQLLLYSPFVLVEYQRHIRQYDGQVPMHRLWLHWFVGSYYALWLLIGALALLQFQVSLRYLLLLGLLVFIASFVIVLLRDPNAISGESDTERVHQTWRFAIAADGLATLADRLHQYMRITRCYLDSSLSLQELSRHLKTQPAKLTRVFNQHLDIGFYDYVNNYRIKAAKKMLSDPARKALSVTDIMLASGFSSNSVFYANFKADTGLTPAQYRKSKIEKSGATAELP
ncbi:helix-turn-helix domain-containing protein [Microbulbifer taiwanensis]|uniref:Helix-turn-helix domain-containing protein n=1 Tax=Microbulbifer taiwanensis TaxID=986746 RepID=A0ABW1YQI1_9GAMM|nr:helix-turn-helix domain-containing protein [Microbulbifer taiwanensis]